MSNKKLLAEAFGTFTLTLIAMFSLVGSFAVPTPILAGLTVMLFVYSIGPISGAHINPAVTLGLWSMGRIKPREAVLYMVSQFVGASLALLTVKYFKVPIQSMPVGRLQIGLAETLGAVVFTFGIASVVFGKLSGGLSGLVIGGSLIVGIAVAALLGSPGILNPAVAMGLQSFSLMTLLGPIVGSLIGMRLYRYIYGNGKK